MTRKINDQVFQLSLTEIALILIFLLMLLLGWLTKSAQNEARISQERADVLAIQFSDVENADKLLKQLEEARQQLIMVIERADVSDPEKLFEDLVRFSSLTDENNILRNELAVFQVEFNELQALVDELGGKNNAEKIVQLSGFLNKDVEQLSEEDISTFFASALLMAQKVDDLTSQNNFLLGRLGGFGAQPCWVENGRAQNLLNITLETDGVSVQVPNLPSHRKVQLELLPSVELATRSFIPYDELSISFGPILNWSKNQKPECRHYARITSNIPLTSLSTPRRLQVTGFFYPNEY